MKDRTESNKKRHGKHKNIYKLLHNTTNQYYSSLEIYKVADKTKFWKPWKVQNFGTIALVGNVVISDNQNIADIFI